MRILWLKSDLLLPLDKGGRLRSWHLLRHLAPRHEITYLAFAEPDQGDVELRGMRDVVAHVETIPRADAPKGTWRFYAGAASHMLDPLPYAVAKYRSRAFRRRVEELFADRSFDLVVSDFLFPAVNLPEHLPCPSVIFTHNVESEIWRRHVETKSGALARALYSMQYQRMLRYERRTLAQFDDVIAVSDADRDTFLRLYPDAIRSRVHVVPTGVDTEYFTPSLADSKPHELVFTGSMDWLPNEDAMLYFCEQVLPRVRVEEPRVRLSIVGRSPTPAVRQLADRGIRVTGRVEDVRPYVQDAAVYIVPLRIGGGTRLKIFEAMAMGKAVVSTTVGAEGLPVVGGEHLVLADGPEPFARSVVDLLRDGPQRNRLGWAARSLVMKHYDWGAVAGALDDAFSRVAATRPVKDNIIPLTARARSREAGALGPSS
jgi:sugar transferase (PEP-CTERM/EpsH1 system associated)